MPYRIWRLYRLSRNAEPSRYKHNRWRWRNGQQHRVGQFRLQFFNPYHAACFNQFATERYIWWKHIRGNCTVRSW
jgi:hypothetical protein